MSLRVNKVLNHDDVLHGEHIEQGNEYIEALQTVLGMSGVLNYKNEMCETLVLIFDEYIRYYLKSAGLGDFTIKPKTKHKEEKIKDTLKWMETFIKEALIPYVGVYCLVPPEQWKNYEMFKLDDIDEVNKLKPVKKKLIAEWRKRPGIIKRLYNE